MNAGGAKTPLAAIFGCAGLHLDASERTFFRDINPCGFILFARNVESPSQLRALTQDLRDSAGREDALILIDQEGGRVARLRPPYWREAPAAAKIGTLAWLELRGAQRAAWLNGRLLADDLASIGVTVDCLPVLDLRHPGAHDIVGDRAFGADPDTVSALGEETCVGLMDGGVLPVIKHIPGHGRAMADSHHELPVVMADRAMLEMSDFVPFRRLAHMPLAMTAHIVYQAIDPEHPATTSAAVVGDVVRGSIGFGGLLMTDDLSMKALGGTLADRTTAALAAGCDVVLHCNGRRDEMEQVVSAARPLDANGMRRYQGAVASLRSPAPFDRQAALAEFERLLQEINEV